MAVPFVSVALALDTIRNVVGLNLNISQNAKAYAARLDAGQPVDSVLPIVVEDGKQYIRRIDDWQLNIPQAKKTAIDAGLAALGVDPAEVAGILAALRPLADLQAKAQATQDPLVVKALLAPALALVPYDVVFLAPAPAVAVAVDDAVAG